MGRVSRRGVYITIGIVLFWLIMTGILLKREVLVKRSPLPVSGSAEQQTGGVRPVDSWMGVYFTDGTKIGYTHTVVRPRPAAPDGGYVARNVTRIGMSLLGYPTVMRATLNWSLDADGKMQDLRFTLDTADSVFAASGEVHGDILRLTVNTGETEFTRDIPISENLFVSSTLSPLMTLPDIEENVEYTVEMLDPVALTTRKATLRAGKSETIQISGEMVDARRIEVDFAGFTAGVWVADDGEVVKVATPVGLVMVKEPPEDAVSGVASGAELPDMAAASAVPTDSVIERPEDVEQLLVRCEGIALDDFAVWDHAQRIVDSETSLIEITKVNPDLEAVPRLPISDSALAEFVEASPFVQSDDPRVVAAAREIVGEETNSWQVALRLFEWVDVEIENEAIASVPSAVDVLRTKKGDCNEHTVLYVALARAVGLPAKTNVGLVYKDGWFYYHAWPEVYVGKWVRMDPTLGQSVADATHIKLTEGEIYRWADILPTIKKLKLDVVQTVYQDGGAIGDVS
jgi:hypothetical protein